MVDFQSICQTTAFMDVVILGKGKKMFIIVNKHVFKKTRISHKYVSFNNIPLMTSNQNNFMVSWMTKCKLRK